ncbi:tubulin-specific chaperone C isoform X2 [Eleginops maclovinus]|uniref:tubulin-specific chaperone C isoform X2 n=1 Tax=Eleginops maclovinus TaxID=56733 RepID=UPI00308023DB
MEAMAEHSRETRVTGESVADKIQERLQKRHQARAEDAERKKEAKESQSVAEEKSEYFASTFNAEQASIEELLSSCSGADRTVVTQTLEEATVKTLQLQKFLNDSILFLTQYELRRAQDALQKLLASSAEIREEALPKKKFAFRARSKATDKVSAPPVIDTPAGTGSTKVVGAPAESLQCCFSNMDNVCLIKTAEDIHKQDVLLTHLNNCKLRTHNTTDTQVYLHVTSRAIVEDCHGVHFAPFTWSYPTLDEDFIVSGLDRDRNNWSQVDDFNWLAAGTPSPNWNVIPEAERKTNWEL